MIANYNTTTLIELLAFIILAGGDIIIVTDFEVVNMPFKLLLLI